MKIFLALFALFAVSTAATVSLKPQQEVESISDFIETVKRIYESLKTKGADLVCSSDLQQLLDILGLPDQLDGAVEMAQSWICGNSAVVKRSDALEGSFIETVLKIWETLKTKGSAFVCSASLQELMDILGLPDQLDGAVAMAQSWICGSSALVKRSDALGGFVDWFKDLLAKLRAYGTDMVCTTKLQDLLDLLGLPDQLDGAVKMAQDLICGNSAVVKRSLPVEMTAERQLQVLEGFQDTVKAIYESLKGYLRVFVCSSRLQALLSLLGLPAELDGAVKMAQEMICGEITELALVATNPAALEGFVETIREIYEKLIELGQTYVCSADVQTIIASLGLPAQLVWALNIALGWLCN